MTTEPQWKSIYPRFYERAVSVGDWSVSQEISADILGAEGRDDFSLDGEWTLREWVSKNGHTIEERKLVCSELNEAMRESEWWLAGHLRLKEESHG